MPLQQHHAQRRPPARVGGGQRHGVAVVDLGFARLGIPGVEQQEGIGHARCCTPLTKPCRYGFPTLERSRAFRHIGRKRLFDAKDMLTAMAYPYSPLGVALGASQAEIKSATRTLAKEQTGRAPCRARVWQ